MDIKKRMDNFKYALAGLKDLFQTEVHAQFHLLAMVLVFVLGLYFNVSYIEWMALIFSIVLVMSAEAFNTAIEHLTNLVSPDYHPLAGRTKDVAAAAVLITAIGAAVVGMLVFVPKVLLVFQ